ncbi:hypothetical protein [Photobacterium profundum]|uniref:hypothetical protein n=1 Tax=Photobacterium profundum TaxID=74109 RepID=UPI000057B731|nr:hypothetical protein [Photobacterium profundum]
MAAIYLNENLYLAYRAVQVFFIENDALPNIRTLARIMEITPDESRSHLNILREKGVITINSQKGFMWRRNRPIIYKK